MEQRHARKQKRFFKPLRPDGILGMELSMPGEASANGIFSKPGSFCRAKILISLAKSGTVNLD